MITRDNVNFHSLQSLFPRCELPVVVSDSTKVRSLFTEQGFRVIDLAEIIRGNIQAPEELLFISCEPKLIPGRQLLNSLFGKSAVMIIPLLSFSANDKAIEYLAKIISKVDWQAACTANLSLVDKLERTLGPIIVKSDRASLSVELSMSLEVALPKLSPRIALGEWVSVGQFLELGLVPNEGHTAFIVDGTLTCDGAAVAHHRHNLAEARPQAFRAWEILSSVRADGGFPLTLTIKSSTVTRIQTSNGGCILHELLPLTDEVFRGKLIEVAFSSIEAYTDVDWTVNSQFNEGAGGCHIALGTGVNAAHIDFISSRASVEFEQFQE